MNIEQVILENFKKKMKEEVKDLNLLVSLSEDTFPDDYGIYSCEVMESKDNGKVWNVICTRNGKIKDIILL